MGLTKHGSQVVFEPLRIHAVKVTGGTVPDGKIDGTVFTVCDKSFVRDGLIRQNAWKDQLLAPVGDRWIGQSAPPCDDCKTALASLEWNDIRRAPQ